MPAHIHAALMAEYAKDAAESKTPWENWEFRNTHFPKWENLTFHPTWSICTKYRRKPKIIRIGTMEVPEPIRTEPNCGDTYWFISFDLSDTHVAASCWERKRVDYNRLKSGVCHFSREAAELHVKAIMKLNFSS